MDRCFDGLCGIEQNRPEWQAEGKFFVCRILERTTRIVIREEAVPPGGLVFYDAIMLLGTKGVNRTEKELRVVGYRVDGKEYWIATNRYDLRAEEVAQVYKLRWTIETFFGWWKRHLKVYHLIARSRYGLMVQLLGGLITYLLLAIYCRKQYNEPVSIRRVRELRHQIANEAAAFHNQRPQKNDRLRKIKRSGWKRRRTKT